MKHLFKGLVAALILTCSSSAIMAQQMPPIPKDPDVRIGKLDNGLTYYIRHNELPKNRTDFYIAQKVGSILEEESQRGLAHFLEHMCFGGTKHFPKKTLINYLESIGVKFGTNLNAYTSIDETVYNISNVPTTRETVIDSCLLILHDWSCDLSLTDEAIDAERGIIHEEWRTRNNAQSRMLKGMCQTFYDNKYAERMPIGLMSVVDNFPYERLRAYYHKWYRPDQQGIVIVGDIDVDKVEAKIKKMFGPIAMPKDAAKREYIPVADNKEPLVYIGKDKEQQMVSIYLYQKTDVVPMEQRENMGYLVNDYLTDMVTTMFNSRLSELTQEANTPFVYAQANYGDFLISCTKDALAMYAGSKEKTIKKSLTTLFSELERLRQFGFTTSEYQRAKADYLSSLETNYKERNKTQNQTYAVKYVRHFIDKSPAPSAEVKFQVLKNVANNIPVTAINQALKQVITQNNIAIGIFGPDKEGVNYPTVEEVKKIIADSYKAKLEPYKDEVSNEPLMKELPKAGKVIKEKELPAYGAKEWTLSNGVKVILKKTDFKDDDITMDAISLGGTSLYGDEDVYNFEGLKDFTEIGGLANFNKIQLDKILAGKIASVNPQIGTRTEGISGHCTPKDFETMMQLTYLTFTAPRYDKEKFNTQRDQIIEMLKNMEKNPQKALGDSIRKAMYGNVPRNVTMNAETLMKIDYDRCMKIFKERFADGNDFTFILVGNIDEIKMKPIIEQYLGALPTLPTQEKYKTINKFLRKGDYKNEFSREAETAKTTYFALHANKAKFSLKNKIKASITGQILTMVGLEEIRTKESGTYGVQASCSLYSYPEEEARLIIYFDTNPDKKDKLVQLVNEVVAKVAQDGPKPEMLDKAKKYLLKKHKENIKTNSYWSNTIYSYLLRDMNMNKNYEKIVSSITAKDIQKFLKPILKHQIEVIMNATSKTK